MKHGLLAIAVAAALSATGCCYYPAYVNPCTGTPCGGTWQPVCGGPCDPLGLGCLLTCCQPICPDPCVDPCVDPCGPIGPAYGGGNYGGGNYGGIRGGYGKGFGRGRRNYGYQQMGPVFQQPSTFANGQDGCCAPNVHGGMMYPSDGVPHESISPMPEPVVPSSPPAEPNNGGSTTYVVPHSSPTPIIHGSSMQPSLQAF